MSLFGPTVIEGEAPETDNEEEVIKEFPEVILGQAITESDNDFEGSISSAMSATKIDNSQSVHSINSIPDEKCESLLVRKLQECNKSLYVTIRDDIKALTSDNNKKLSSTNQSLLQSQVTLQTAVTNLKLLNNTATSMRNRMDDIVSLNFFSNVKTS